jgi:DNA helicase II / ATP-dependent DNA helicase PcrA
MGRCRDGLVYGSIHPIDPALIGPEHADRPGSAGSSAGMSSRHDHPDVIPSGSASPPLAAPIQVPEIPAEEERMLARVRRSLADQAASSTRAAQAPQDRSNATSLRSDVRHVEAMVALRDEIGEARLEDVPALVAQMERLQNVALTRAELQTILVDPASPYFGHLRLRERVPGRGVVERDVFVGRATFVDPRARVNIVDWRNAPVSQLFYRYGEGSDYEERFGDRDVEGEIVVRRTVTIEAGNLLRISCPQGVWVKRRIGLGESSSTGASTAWERTDLPAHELAGGEASATRPGRASRPSGVLGSAPDERRGLDRHLPEIAALIDPRQFDIITSRQSGVAIIQGGAGSGKTTIGLHRLAYLAYAFPDRFPPHRLLVVTYGVALAAYIDQVLPSLGIRGVRVMPFHNWAEKELRAAIPWLRATIVDDPSPAVTRVKSHPALLHELERRAALHPPGTKRDSRAVVELWAELLTDRSRLMALLREGSETPLSESDILEAHRIMVARVAAIVGRDPRDRPAETKTNRKRMRGRRSPVPGDADGVSATHWAAVGLAAKPGARTVDSDLPEGIRRLESERDDFDDDQNIRGETGIDGLRTEDDAPLLDLDDAAILLRAHQLLRGVKQPLAHLFVDEAQDLSPTKLSVLMGYTDGGHQPVRSAGKSGRASGNSSTRTTITPSITLAGDTSQKLFLDNGFGDWRSVLGHLALSHVSIQPLRIAYRSTREILALARHAMGPLMDEVPPEAPRGGAPVEAFRFSAAGAAVAFLAEALRDLAAREPRATIALLARHPEQADRYYQGLRGAEVPALRRVRSQEFTFRPGIEVTDVRQVKGLEFDYVLMVDANASSYGLDDESRHLFHIGVTRAAHQLWLIITGPPSPLLPSELVPE